MRLAFLMTGCCLFGLCFAARLHAQDEAKPKSKGAAKAKAAADPAEWKALIERRDQMMKDLGKLKEEFEAANEGGKQKIAQRAQQMQAEFYGEIQRKIMELGPAVYAKNPTDPDAAQVAAMKAYSDHKFEEALGIIQKVLDSGKKMLPLFAAKATFQFAMNDFGDALKTLKDAQKANPTEFERDLKPMFDQYTQYAKYWKEEQATRAKEAQADDLPRVLFKTSKGDVLLELFENEAPNTVANFINLVESGKYDGTEFHRVIPLFMAQGGDPNTLDDDPSNDGQGGLGYTIACECYDEDARKHFQGSISMAHAGKDTGSSQFFLTHIPTAHLNYVEGKEEANHTVFGRIIKGLDNALALKKGDKLISAKVVRKRDHKYAPKKIADQRPGRQPAKK